MSVYRACQNDEKKYGHRMGSNTKSNNTNVFANFDDCANF